MSHLELVALVVRDYDAAIRFFVDVLQFKLVEDTPSLTNDGRPKPVVSDYSCASTTSIWPTSAWWSPVCGSSRRLAMSLTADLRCFWILKGTAGTSWTRPAAIGASVRELVFRSNPSAYRNQSGLIPHGPGQ